MAPTFDELQDWAYQAYQEVQAEHQLYVPPSNVGPGVLSWTRPGHFEWTFTFDMSTHPADTQITELARAMHDALERTVKGTGVHVDPPIIESDRHAYRIPLHTRQPSDEA